MYPINTRIRLLKLFNALRVLPNSKPLGPCHDQTLPGNDQGDWSHVSVARGWQCNVHHQHGPVSMPWGFVAYQYPQYHIPGCYLLLNEKTDCSAWHLIVVNILITLTYAILSWIVKLTRAYVCGSVITVEV